MCKECNDLQAAGEAEEFQRWVSMVPQQRRREILDEIKRYLNRVDMSEVTRQEARPPNFAYHHWLWIVDQLK